jgi:hypothetical protein
MDMRQVLAATALIPVIIGAVAGCASQATPPRTRTTHTASLGRHPARLLTHLQQPEALATGPDGQIYVADDTLNEILMVLPGGRFQVIAGERQGRVLRRRRPGGQRITRRSRRHGRDKR